MKTRTLFGIFSGPVPLTAILFCCLMVFAVPPMATGAEQAEQFNTAAEKLGGLRLGLGEKAAGEAVRCKASKGKEILEGATGEYVQTWKYPECGIVLKMSSERKGGPKKIASITVTSPGKFSTAGGIGIGSAEKEVIKAYGRYRDSEYTRPGKKFVAGSVYDGLIFDFRDGKVVGIFLGAAAE